MAQKAKKPDANNREEPAERPAAQTAYWVYMLKCSDGTYYTGITTDIERRLAEHNAGSGAKYTRSRTPVTCVYMEECLGRSEASKREAAIKKLRRPQKEKLASASRKAPAPTNANVHKSMQGNKGKNTKPELLVRKKLREVGLSGYRLHWNVPGKPDIAWPGKKVAIFVSGCFWHRCPKCNLALPKSHTEYWVIKFDTNVARDRRNIEALESNGWTVHVIWECELKKKVIDKTFDELLPQLSDELGKPLRL